MIRVLYFILCLGITGVHALQGGSIPGSPMPGATGSDSDSDGIDDAFDATPTGSGTMNASQGRNNSQDLGSDDFNPDDPAGTDDPLAGDDDNFTSPLGANAPRSQQPRPVAGMIDPMNQSNPRSIGRGISDPDRTRGAMNDTDTGSNIPNFKNFPDDKQHHKLKGMENIRALQTALLEGDKEGLCGENGTCRRNFGEGCTTSKNFLSVCATLCVDNNEFRGSHCVVNGAKRYKMNPQTFIYEPRPDKQKKAESVADHIIIQLREGRKALRSDKRLFFNTFCTPPSINMIPGDGNKRRIAEACAYFLYNGFPPPGVLQKILIGGPGQPQPYTPPPMPMVGQQPPAAGMMPMGGMPPAGGPDDINAPAGGLPGDPNAGEDKGAVYTGPGQPIIEDKEAAPKKGKKSKKSKKTKKAPAKQAAPAMEPDDSTPPNVGAPSADGMTPDDQATMAGDGGTPDPSTSGDPATDTDPATAMPNAAMDPNTAADPTAQAAAAPMTPQPQPAAPTAQAAPAPAAEPKKDKGIMGALGGAGGLQGMMSKFGKKGNKQQQQADPNADPNAAPDQAAGGQKAPSALGKFLKF